MSRAYLGIARCRICSQDVGNVELSDGVYSWPEGLRHYVKEHAIALPRVFVDHVRDVEVSLSDAEVDDTWWASVMGNQSGS